MKSGVLILVAIGVFYGEITALELLTRGFSLGPRSGLSVDCKNKFGFVCENCTHIKLCAHVDVTIQACSSVSSDAPYCDMAVGSCTADATGSDGKTCTPHFDCMGAGIYPDLTDCTRYFLCERAGKEPEMFQCPPGRVYSSKLEGCKLKKVPADCETVNCATAPGRIQVLKSDPSVLSVCPADGGNPFVLRCRDTVYNEYNPKTLMCDYKCPATEGRYPDRLDCHKFYECYKIGTVMSYMHQDCGSKFKYDKDEKKCILSDDCKPEVAPEPDPEPQTPPTTEPDPKPPSGEDKDDSQKSLSSKS